MAQTLQPRFTRAAALISSKRRGFVGDLAEGTGKAESLTQPHGRVLTARLAATTFTLACHDPSRSLIVAISVT